MSSEYTDHERAVALNRATKCKISGVDDEWVIDELDYADELREAIKTVRDDHDEIVIVESESIWLHRVIWNESWGDVQVSTFGYHGGFKVNDGPIEEGSE